MIALNTKSADQACQLGQDDFARISQFVHTQYGIQLPETKMKMVEARLQRRLRALGFEQFSDYLDLVFGKPGGEEYMKMIDAITTNKTDFFREPAHFHFLENELLPAVYNNKATTDPLRIWSAACSSGEEVYSIAITIEEFHRQLGRPLKYQVDGTDLSTRVLNVAQRGVYDETKLNSVPLHIKKRYFLKSKDEQNPKGKIKPAFRQKIAFRRLNLVKEYSSPGYRYDAIFCRNVLIYFDRRTQARVVSTLCEHLVPGGHLFIGHSESLTNMDLPLVQVRPTIYRRA